jgi:quercetin dioxygenase-like cupin family protein
MTRSTSTEARPSETPADDHAYLRTHRISGDVQRFQLSLEASRLHEQASASPAGRAGKTLVKEGSLRITQLALRKDMRLPWHEVEGAVCVQILRGRLQMVTPEGKMGLARGALVVFDAGVQHSAVATSDCVMLITISMPEAARE